MTVTKPCPRCEQDLPLTAFSVRPAAATGRSSWCKACVRAKVAERRADPALRERDRAYNRANARALVRLARLHPLDFEDLLNAELAAEGWERTTAECASCEEAVR